MKQDYSLKTSSQITSAEVGSTVLKNGEKRMCC